LAGIVPELYNKNNNWKFTYFKLYEDNDPFRALAKALLPLCSGIKLFDDEDLSEINCAKLSILLNDKQEIFGEILTKIQHNNSLLIIADQFEEVLSYKSFSDTESSDDYRFHFLDTLVKGIKSASENRSAKDHSNRIVWISTIRDTTIGNQLALYTNHIGRDPYILGPLDKNQFKAVIKDPLSSKGTITEEAFKALEKTFIKDDQVKNLPLLQYTLSALWNTRNQNNEINLDTIGKEGVEGILKSKANEMYQKSLTEKKEEVFKKLFLDLISIDPKNGSTLCIRKRTALGDDAWKLAEELEKNSGLIQISNIKDGNSTVYTAEITHEELIKYWDKLREWVDTAEKEARIRFDLLDKAAKWEEANPKIQTHSIFYSLFREDHLLLRGDELKDASVIEENPISALSDVEKKFLEASRRHSRWVRRRIPVVCLTACLAFMVLISVIYISNISGMRSQLKIDTLNRLSLGEKYFFTQTTQEDSSKREGVWHFEKRNKENYEKAINAFDKHVNKYDDPEAKIYLNNAKFLKKYINTISPIIELPIIAVSVPIQKNVTISREILRGVAHAQDDVWKCISEPKQCPDSRKQFPFLVMLASDDNDPEVAKRIAEYLVHGEDTLFPLLPETVREFVDNLEIGVTKRDRVIAVVGHNASDVTKSVMPIYQNKMVMISPTSTTLSADDVKVKAKDNFTYLISYSNKDLATNLINHLKPKEGSKLLYCHDKKVDKAKLEEGFKKVIGSADTKCVFKEDEVDSVFEKLGDEVTHILLAPHASTITDSIFIARENNKEENKKVKRELLGTATLYSKEVSEAKEESFVGMTLAISWHQEWEPEDKKISEKIRNFAKAANSKWHYEPGSVESLMNITWRTAAAYDATKLISISLNKILDLQAKDTNFEDKTIPIPSQSELQHKIVESLPFEGVTGKIEFDDYGIRTKGSGELPSILLHITKGNEESYKFELLKE
jgi:ABC-type branched-subunit amino acid transport system substrate-binding protein